MAFGHLIYISKKNLGKIYIMKEHNSLYIVLKDWSCTLFCLLQGSLTKDGNG